MLEIIKYTNGLTDGLVGAEIVTGFKSKMWVERYSGMSVFELRSIYIDDARYKLPLGTLVSHTATAELMIVTEHTIDASGDPQEVVIRGKSFVSILEGRIVGSNAAAPQPAAKSLYHIPTMNSAAAAASLIEAHIDPALVDNPIGGIEHVAVYPLITRSDELDLKMYDIPVGTVFERAKEILDADYLGMRTIRPGALSYSNTDALIVIHDGTDKSDTVQFSPATISFDKADYLWTKENYYNGAYATSTWLQRTYWPSMNGINARMLYLDLSWLDESWEEMPTAAEQAALLDRMDFIMHQTLLTKAETFLLTLETENIGSKLTHRLDYNVGDLVSVVGVHGDSGIRRVSEYAEFEDESGFRSAPTFEMI